MCDYVGALRITDGNRKASQILSPDITSLVQKAGSRRDGKGRNQSWCQKKHLLDSKSSEFFWVSVGFNLFITFILGLSLYSSKLKYIFLAFCSQMPVLKVLTSSPLSLGAGEGQRSCP